MLCSMIHNLAACCLLLGGGDTTVVTRAAAELDPQTQSTIQTVGSMLHWSPAAGDQLALRLTTDQGGNYAITVLVQHAPDAPAISARIWDEALWCNGAPLVDLGGAGQHRLAPIEFDPIDIGPGQHVLELTSHEAGKIVVDQVTMMRLGDWDIGQRSQDSNGVPFLGIGIGPSGPHGVELESVVTSGPAANAGLMAGDVLRRIDGHRTDTRQHISEALLEHEPGDQVELELQRDDQVMTVTVQLTRYRDTRSDSSRARHVLATLDVKPNEVIADLGCGSGWLSQAIADAVGPGGQVYAVEISEGRIRALRRQTAPNVVPVYGLPDNPLLPTSSLDTAMLHDVASHIERSARPGFYRNLARALTAHGKLVIFGPHGKALAMLDELRDYGFVPIDAEALTAMSPDELDKRLWDGITLRFVQP
jgi:SAM-dependent methyltransferase